MKKVLDDGALSPTIESLQPTISHEVAELHTAYAEALLRFGATFTPDAAACHDAVQEAFLRYFIERRYGRTIIHPQAWLYRVVRNYLLDRMRTASARQEVTVLDAQSVPTRQCNPEVAVHGTEIAREITAALSARELECLRLRATGLSYDEIGQSMIISPGTVAAMLGRVHSKLRSLGINSTVAATGEALRCLAMEALPDPS